LFDFVPFWIEHVDSCCFSPTALSLSLFRCLFGNCQHLLVNFLVSISQIMKGCHEISRWWTENKTQKKALVWLFKGRRIPCDLKFVFSILKIIKNWLRIECIEGHPFKQSSNLTEKKKKQTCRENCLSNRAEGERGNVCVCIYNNIM
jgi:hypothetical protein